MVIESVPFLGWFPCKGRPLAKQLYLTSESNGLLDFKWSGNWDWPFSGLTMQIEFSLKKLIEAIFFLNFPNKFSLSSPKDTTQNVILVTVGPPKSAKRAIIVWFYRFSTDEIISRNAKATTTSSWLPHSLRTVRPQPGARKRHSNLTPQVEEGFVHTRVKVRLVQLFEEPEYVHKICLIKVSVFILLTSFLVNDF